MEMLENVKKKQRVLHCCFMLSQNTENVLKSCHYDVKMFLAERFSGKNHKGGQSFWQGFDGMM